MAISVLHNYNPLVNDVSTSARRQAFQKNRTHCTTGVERALNARQEPPEPPDDYKCIR